MDRTLRLASIGLLALIWLNIVLTAYVSDWYVFWWAAHQPADLYGGAWNHDLLSFVYTPAFAQLAWPVSLLPAEAWYLLWTAGLVALLAWLVSPPLAVMLLIPFDPFRHEIASGNVNLLLAAGLVLAFRHSSAWAFLLLSKVTPGVGLVWYAVRRQWRELAIALGISAALVAASFTLAPHLWWSWLERVTASAGVAPYPLAPRLALAAVLVGIGAWRDWRWLLPLAVLLALPNFGASISFSILAAMWRLRGSLRAPQAEAEARIGGVVTV